MMRLEADFILDGSIKSFCYSKRSGVNAIDGQDILETPYSSSSTAKSSCPLLTGRKPLELSKIFRPKPLRKAEDFELPQAAARTSPKRVRVRIRKILIGLLISFSFYHFCLVASVRFPQPTNAV